MKGINFMKRIFISQPMRGKTDKEILNERNSAIDKVKEMYPDEEVVITESYFSDFNDKKLDKRKINIPLFYLGQSFLKLAESDIACFCKGWEDARGCLLEHSAAKTYGIETIYL